jgi:hypothetical protein
MNESLLAVQHLLTLSALGKLIWSGSKRVLSIKLNWLSTEPVKFTYNDGSLSEQLIAVRVHNGLFRQDPIVAIGFIDKRTSTSGSLSTSHWVFRGPSYQEMYVSLSNLMRTRFCEIEDLRHLKIVARFASGKIKKTRVSVLTKSGSSKIACG